ncbi:MAG TPA: uracil-DNA glycosylase [Gemmatimonadaceae bacterium]|nr:uracil-DNA glycosylase [Gemmatimonadaceae bacterium]
MDAREALRRYLEQRRELGESELVLDSLSVEEALRLIGATGKGKRRHGGDDVSISSADWRAALREAGAQPEPATSSRAATREPPAAGQPSEEKLEDDAVHVPSTQSTAASQSLESPIEGVPTGIIVGGASRALAEDPAFKLDTLSEIAKVVAECTRCPLYATAKNPVPGVGDPNADFMLVGEAPGANEDEQGEPFVGQAGQLLNKIIGAIGLTRDDVFIANVLKHRPPGNRNPLPDEITACSPYLVRQIELIRPKVIVALGTFAAQTLLDTKLTIGKLRGQVHRYYGVPLVVTYHPAALLRNQAWKRPTWEDVQLARRILDRANAPRA